MAIPHVESRYRTLPERILVGHSLGELFAASAFIDQRALLAHYIAIGIPTTSDCAGTRAVNAVTLPPGPAAS